MPTVSQVGKLDKTPHTFHQALIAVSPINTWSYYTWVGEDRTGLNLWHVRSEFLRSARSKCCSSWLLIALAFLLPCGAYRYILVQNRRCTLTFPAHSTCQYEPTFGDSSQYECIKVSVRWPQYQFSLYFTNVYFPNIAIQYIVSQCSGPANLISSVWTSEVSKSQIFFITVVLRVWMQIGSRQATTSYVALSQVPQQCQLENLAIAIDTALILSRCIYFCNQMTASIYLYQV